MTIRRWRAVGALLTLAAHWLGNGSAAAERSAEDRPLQFSLAVVLLALLSLAPGGGAAYAGETAAVYNLGSDFSVALNPNGPWEYGFSAAASLAPDGFTLATVAQAGSASGIWHPPDGDNPHP